MYKIYGILGAEYSRHDYHRASGAKPLVRSRVRGQSPLQLKAILYFGRPVEAATLWLGGGARAPPPVDPPMYVFQCC